MKPYRPSNGTEMQIFQCNWCEKCEWWPLAPADPNQCGIFAMAIVHEVEDPEYPKEWVVESEDNPFFGVCTAFVERDTDEAAALHWAKKVEGLESEGQMRLEL